MELLTAWNSRASAISYAPIITQATCTSSPFQRPSLPPHQLSFPFCPCPFRFVPNKSLTLHARKRNSEPEQHPLLRPTIIEEVSEDDEGDDVILDDFEDEASIEDGDDYYEDDSAADDAELYDGDGGGGGGISLAGTWWDQKALEIAEEVILSFDGDLKIYAFKTLPNFTIQVRIEKLSNRSGSPSMEDIEAFSRTYRTRLDEAEVARSVPENLCLEVSSPGVERVVQIPHDLDRYKDRPMYVKYQQVANRKLRAIQIDLEDLFNYQDFDEEFLRRVTENTRRYVGIFADAIDELMPEPTEPFTDDDHDILMTQRSDDGPENMDGSDPHQKMPPEIKRYFEVYIRASSKGQPFTIREVKASYIGQLVRISGIVTRCSDVKPLMQVAVYTCEECGFEIFQEVTARIFMPLFQCPSRRCDINKTKGNLILQLRASKFLKFQEAKIQELTEHVPKGHIPRTMTVHFRGELTRKVAPGDVVELSGIFLPIPYTGFRAMRAGLVADTYLEAMSVTHYKKKYDDSSGDEEEQIRSLADDGDIYNKLAQSLAPEIYGHEDIKKALLLLLVGAPHRKLKDGMKIRGDLHICLMGDPGVAKSQLHKHIINVAPRGVYTTGKGSSGVGLTAAVQKDPVTNEMVLEGGAMVLADMGICAIYEFDKMDELDRTAIHEVMEQQTVSIAKAGITTSLNARTAVLAAANPVRAYISAARRLSPSVPQELEEYIASAYSTIRQEEAKSNAPHSYTTVRTLLSILHISAALARLRFSETVAQSDVDESLSLMQMSKFSLHSDDCQRSGLDAISDIYSILRDEAARTNKLDVSYAHALNWISRKGYSEAPLKECLEEYAALNVWQINPQTFDIRFIDA